MPQVIFVGEEPIRSSPSLSLSRVLEAHGHEINFANDVLRASTKEWLTLARSSVAIIYVQYDTLDPFFLRQLALAVSAGVPMIRWWVGSDVLRPLRCEKERDYATKVQSISMAQITVSPHLEEELAQVGILATMLPSVIDSQADVKVAEQVPQRILTYIPPHKREFYGAGMVRQAALHFPDLEFVVVADEACQWRDLPNVRCLGWVDDMESVWEQVGGVLRVTEHDGLPRMVLDGLRRGKFVFYSWPLEGCELVKDFEDVRAALQRFRLANTPNWSGVKAVQQWLEPSPGDRWRELLLRLRYVSLLKRLVATNMVVTETSRVRRRLREQIAC